MTPLQLFIGGLSRVHLAVMAWTHAPGTLISMKTSASATTEAGPEKGRRMENRATALAPWTGWIAGIALSWTASGLVAAGAWWVLYWPTLLGIAVAYSRLEEHRQAEVAADSMLRS
jgi:hypothetical protein